MNINDPLPGRGLAIPFTKAANPNNQLEHKDLRIPFLSKVPDVYRNHFIAMCGEFVGTVLFLYFALSGTQVANSVITSSGVSTAAEGSNLQQLLYISLCFGFSLAVNAWVFFRISGGLFNPAVTLGMCLIGALPWIRGALLIFTQIVAGICSAALVSCMFPGELNVRTSLGGGTTIVQGLFLEMFLTAQLVFTIFMLAAEKHKGTFIAPVGIGLALFIAELSGVYFTGGSLNPARTFGPAVVDTTFEHYHWIYWLGPVLGSIIAAGFYKFIKVLEYETANPGQDMDHAARVAHKQNLLVAAGINDVDAKIVAHELAQNGVRGADPNGPNPVVLANGQGRTSQEVDANGMYGTNFNYVKPATGLARDSGASEATYVHPQRPVAVTTGSQLGRYSYLGQAGRNQSIANSNNRLTSPAMGTNEEIYAPFHTEKDEALGGNPIVDPEPRNRFARTTSSGV